MMNLRGVRGRVSKAGFRYELAAGTGFIASKDGVTIGRVMKVGKTWRAHLPGGIIARGETRDEAVLKALEEQGRRRA